MATPSFINAGASNHQNAVNNITLALPALLNVGDTLIGFVMVSNAPATFTWPAGWTQIDFIAPAGDFMSASYAWYVVGASNANPNITCSASSNISGQITHYSASVASPPIGAFKKTTSLNGVSATFSGGGLATTGVNSLVVDLETTFTGTIATPAGYNAEVGPTNSLLFSDVVMTSPGSTPAISYNQGNTSTHFDFQVELLNGPVPHPKMAAVLVGG
jgi:hypothetical protein